MLALMVLVGAFDEMRLASCVYLVLALIPPALPIKVATGIGPRLLRPPNGDEPPNNSLKLTRRARG